MGTPNNQQPNKPTVLPVLIPVKMGFDANKQRDPVARAERNMTALSPDIGNNGDSLYNNEEFSIVCRFKSHDDMERDENEDNGYGAVTNGEYMIIQECSFYEEYNDDDWTWAYEEDYVYIDPYYRELMENGEMVDDGMSCRMVLKDDTGAIITREQMEAARQQDADNVVTAETQADGPSAGDGTTEPVADASTKADATAPEQSAAAPATSATEPGIESGVDLSGAFTGAATPKEEAPADLAVAAQPVSPQVVSANNQSFQMSA